jgi:hypothetical protein
MKGSNSNGIAEYAGDAAGWRYVEFFTANIRSPNTRRAYSREMGRARPGGRWRAMSRATLPH